MKFCTCGGDLLRHGITRYKRKSDSDILGIRYKCRECSKSFTVRIPKIAVKHDPIRFNQTGRPHQCDWRMKNITEARTK